MNHLGGHYNGTAMTIPVFDYLKNKFNIKSVIDVGCGPGGMTEYINYRGTYCIGIDGDTSIEKKDYIIFHDYTLGFLELNKTFDLTYSTEFLEHIESKYIPNFMDTFKKSKYVFCTAAFPGQGGHHHVNEQYPDYWIKVFSDYNFEIDEKTLNEIKNLCEDKMITRNSLFFKNKETIEETQHDLPFSINYENLKSCVNRHYDINGKIVGYEKW